jgi:hypothetical protein
LPDSIVGFDDEALFEQVRDSVIGKDRLAAFMMA